MKHKRNVAIAIVLSAAAGFLALKNVSAPTPDSTTQIPVTAETVVTETATPIVEGSYSGSCFYVWAYQDAPELTTKLDEMIKNINPAANARAQLFGEDCVYADGHTTFGAMETDFYVNLPVDNLTDKESFGNWMAQVMEMIVKIPREQMPGNYGFVEFLFGKLETEHVLVRVPIQRYMNEAQGKTGAELFLTFYVAP